MIRDHIRANFQTLMSATETGASRLRLCAAGPTAAHIHSPSSAIWRRPILTRRTTRQSESRPG